jgi:glutathione S-transferase
MLNCCVQALEWFEGTALTRHEGPYLLGDEFSMLDIMMISSMERIGAGMSVLVPMLLCCYIGC